MKEKEIYWSRFADNFDELNTYVVGKSDMEIIINEISALADLKNTLELACGNGTYTGVLSRNADKITATDYSDEMVKVTTEKFSNADKIKVEKADAFNLKYDENSFDTVFISNLLHIVPNPEDIVKEVKKVLKQGGRIIILEFGKEGMSFFNQLGMIFRYLKTYGKPPAGATITTTESIKGYLENCGYRAERIELIGKRLKAAFAVGVKQ